MHEKFPLTEPAKELFYGVLSDREAGFIHLNVVAFRATVDQLYARELITEIDSVVSLREKSGDRRIAGLCILKRKDIESQDISAFSTGTPVPRLTPSTNRYRYYEVSYVVRSEDFRGQGVGPIVLACGMEFVFQKVKRASLCFWLEVG